MTFPYNFTPLPTDLYYSCECFERLGNVSKHNQTQKNPKHVSHCVILMCGKYIFQEKRLVVGKKHNHIPLISNSSTQRGGERTRQHPISPEVALRWFTTRQHTDSAAWDGAITVGDAFKYPRVDCSFKLWVVTRLRRIRGCTERHFRCIAPKRTSRLCTPKTPVTSAAAACTEETGGLPAWAVCKLWLDYVTIVQTLSCGSFRLHAGRLDPLF